MEVAIKEGDTVLLGGGKKAIKIEISSLDAVPEEIGSQAEPTVLASRMILRDEIVDRDLAKRKIDYAEWGGAPLLGVRCPAFVCHGASNAKAIQNALIHAARYAERDLSTALGQSIAAHDALFATARAAAKPKKGNGAGATRSGDAAARSVPSRKKEKDDSIANHSLRARSPG